MKHPVFSIIVTFNGIKWIEKCIKSVYSDSSVIVVDNGSNDGTVEFIDNHFPDVILLKQETNIGFGQANNIGMSYALSHGAEAVFLLNQDAWLEKDGLKKLKRVSVDFKDFGVISPIHLNGNNSNFDLSFRNLASRELLSDFAFKEFSKKIYPCPFINAAAWYIRVEVLKRVGGFDPSFFFYGEDVNLAQRMKFHRYRLGYIPNTLVFHDSKNIFYHQSKKESSEYLFKLENSFKVILLDINSRILITYCKMTLNFINKIAICLLTNPQSIKLILRNFLIFLSVRFYKSRKTNKKIGPHYLDVQK